MYGKELDITQHTGIKFLEKSHCIIDPTIKNRVSQDKRPLNNNGKRLIEFCKCSSLIILNGRVGEDAGIGKYTHINSNSSGVLDYMICSPSLINNIKQFKVHSSLPESDHCPLHLSIECKFDSSKIDQKMEGQWESHYKYVWNKKKSF